MRLLDHRLRLRRSLKRCGRNRLIFFDSSSGQFGGLRDICAVFKMDIKHQSVIGRRYRYATAKKFELIRIDETAAGEQRFAINLHRRIASYRLHKRRAIKKVDQYNRTAARSWQAETAIAAGSDAQWQATSVNSPFAFNVLDNQMIETQIASSQRITTGLGSSSGPTINSSRTSRYPGRLPTATYVPGRRLSSCVAKLPSLPTL